ncbi:MAG: hypothetical protein QQW96_10845 [Tychonema bourrellyi B0820]|uniref:Uncharacterized protein n=1 Tax=Tychonema bourrellyi FEM_GT703 TaxID=2040638 RepID=A0A2G4F602_9CYAN|nr:hypothetical protein [Tychonema bourrellyi]MDQ2098134.1 hypothetical protein [Tychonema bourrellyi B0820]PHX57214.1 hypothetical protein CP500_001470 [Tychonema bourrellyi FEM_GT703]
MTNDSDPNFQIEVQRLHKLTVYGRWLTVIFLWISIGSFSIWGLRDEIALWIENFTWAAVRYGLYFHRWPTLGLGLCLGMTLAVLTWQGRNIVRGLPLREKRRLEEQVRRIRQQGSSHPLWKWVCRF